MNQNYQIRYSPLFEADLTKIIEYIVCKLNNLQAAESLLGEVERSIIERSKCPLAFEPYPSIKHREYQYYRIFIKNFIVFYIVTGNVIEVRRILYKRRNIKEQLS